MMNGDRRKAISLTDAEIDLIAEKAAEKAVAKMTSLVYREVGKNVISKFFWIIGVLAAALYVWAQQKGLFK